MATHEDGRRGWGTPKLDQSGRANPISMGVIVNFTAGTVTGFTYPGANLPVKITTYDEVAILFGTDDDGPKAKSSWSIDGSIDRVTGDVAAYSVMRNAKGDITKSTEYSLKCKPTQRMF